jgi:hypothetical protein
MANRQSATGMLRFPETRVATISKGGAMASTMSPAPSKIPEMRVPRPNLSVTLLSIAVVFFLTVAIFNLAHYDHTPLISLLASVAYLLLLLSLVVTACRETGGIRQFAINRFGVLGFKQFVQVRPIRECPILEVAFGYRMFGWPLYYFRVDASRIISIGWHPGQASGMTGEDMNDWSVWLCYKRNESELNSVPAWDRGRKGFYEIGPCGEKEKINELGHALIAFLGRSEIRLAQTDSGRRKADKGCGDEYGLSERCIDEGV